MLKYLGKTTADDEPLALVTILDSNGLDDALWCTRAIPEHDREWRLYAVWCARQVQHLMHDQRSIDALDIAEKFALGNATETEHLAAWSAAFAAAGDAPGAASRAATFAASGTVAGDAAWSAQEAEFRRIITTEGTL